MAILAAAIVAIVIVQSRGGQSAKPAATPPAVATAAPTLARRIDGVPCNNASIGYHVHAHLQIVYEGKNLALPANIGIDDNTCAYYLHTHDDSGIIHTESPTPVPNRLAQFFIEWGVRLTPSCVGTYCRPTSIKVFVDGQPFAGDPRTIQLTDHKEIAVVIGTPPKTIPSTADFSNA